MPSNTTGGLPYPVATDPLTNGAAAIQALAEALDAAWTAFTFSSGWANVSAAMPCQFRKIGPWIELRGIAFASAGLGTPLAATQIASNLPASLASDSTMLLIAGLSAAAAPKGFMLLSARSNGALVGYASVAATPSAAVTLDGLRYRAG